MAKFEPLAESEHVKIQLIAVPQEGDIPEHVAVFVEAQELATVRRHVQRLHDSTGVFQAGFSEPEETARGTYSCHGYLIPVALAGPREGHENNSREGVAFFSEGA